jgi:VWFA-related protein
MMDEAACLLKGRFMCTPRLVRSLVVASGLGILAISGPTARLQGQQADQAPTFRTDASFVLTDVFVTADGKPVTDLTQADFEVREDGVVQTIRSFEAVRHSLQPSGVPRRNPSTVAESEAMAADPRRRVFVVFLDTFHVDRANSMRTRETLQTFLKSALGPDDLVAYLTPHMSGRDISFSSSTDALVRFFDDNPVWGVADELPGAETDLLEKNWQSCFGASADQNATWLGLRSRLREQKSLDALRGLVAYLDGIRESRKAVIAVTSGWRLFTDHERHLSEMLKSGGIPGAHPIGVGPDGVLGTPNRSRLGGVTNQTCDNLFQQAGFADSRVQFQDLIGEANRSSTSFYAVDARGLRPEGRPVTTNALDSLAEMRNRERMPFSTTLDSLRTLGEATNGMAVINTNDLAGGLASAAADFNHYYLLGYTSSNGQADGKYRKIKVAVKRPGVQVRARDGYLARRSDDRPPALTGGPGGAAASPEAAQVTAALGKLAPPRPGVPLVVTATAGAAPGGTAQVIRVVAELDATIAATPEWAEGGEAQAFVRNVKGENVTSGNAKLAKGSRTVEVELPVTEAMKGDVKVQVRLTGSGPLARYTDATNVSLDALPGGWGAPRLSRRGPSTGIAWVPTADPRFRRQERVRVSVGVAPDAGTVVGALLDRQGKPINVPVRIDQAEPATLVAELALAPLAVGDYVLALGGAPKRLLVALRVVP